MTNKKQALTVALITLLILSNQAVHAQYFLGGYSGSIPSIGVDENFASYKPFPNEFEKMNLQGFDVYVNKSIAEKPETLAALDALDEDLEYVAGIVKANQLKLFRQIKIWIEIKNQPRGSAMYLKNVSDEWMTANGYPKEARKSVEITNVKNYVAWRNVNQPLLILHEMAHSYHDLHLSQEVKEYVTETYNNALNSKKYDLVKDTLGNKKRAYALTSVDEYFAEITEAYFGENDFYPFNREDLEEFDPEGFELMQSVWD